MSKRHISPFKNGLNSLCLPLISPQSACFGLASWEPRTTMSGCNSYNNINSLHKWKVLVKHVLETLIVQWTMSLLLITGHWAGTNVPRSMCWTGPYFVSLLVNGAVGGSRDEEGTRTISPAASQVIRSTTFSSGLPKRRWWEWLFRLGALP